LVPGEAVQNPGTEDRQWPFWNEETLFWRQTLENGFSETPETKRE